MMNRRTWPSWRRAVLAIAVAGLAGQTAPVAEAASSSTGCGASCQASLATAREASQKYQDVKVALAEGFVPFSECIEGQGVHFVNIARLTTPEVDVRYPEILLYLPAGETDYQLVGIEHVKVDDDQDLATDDDRPTLYDQPFIGPMVGHDEPLHAEPKHFERHVWLYSSKWLDGMFVQHNEAVSCPD